MCLQIACENPDYMKLFRQLAENKLGGQIPTSLFEVSQYKYDNGGCHVANSFIWLYCLGLKTLSLFPCLIESGIFSVTVLLETTSIVV